MARVYFESKLSVIFLKEGRRFVAYAPALDLSTSGKTHEEVRKRFGEAAMLFFHELGRHGTTGEVLQDLGWQQIKKEWRPPVFIGQESESVRVPVPVSK